MIPDEKISDIRNAADIVEIVSESVLLKKAGRDYVGLCPFHSEKTPSFTVSPEKQFFYCFGCGEGGNVIGFLMKRDGFSFAETARALAKRYGIALPEQALTPEEKKRVDEREAIFLLNRDAAAYFRLQLESPTGKTARDYLAKRGMTPTVLEDFQIGYAPEGWDHLLRNFPNRPLPLLHQAGLVIPRNNGNGYYDRFRGRIIFPIIDTRNQMVGFGGRVMDDTLPKYLNSPETPVYNKSRTLYGLKQCHRACREEKTVYIVEGYFDLLALYRNGIKNAAATLGTALTPFHLRLLKGYAKTAILVFDSDAAGVRAAHRSIPIFREENMDARILVLPSGYDPDSFLEAFGPDAFFDTAKKARSIISFLITTAIELHGTSIEGKARIVSELREPISSIQDSVARSLYVKELAERVGIEEATVLEKIKGAVIRSGLGKAVPVPRRSKTSEGRRKIERKLIEMMIFFPDIMPEIRERKPIMAHVKDPLLQSIGQALLDEPGRPDEIIARMDPERQRVAASLAMGKDLWDREGCIRLMDQFETGLEKIRFQDKKKAVKHDPNLLLEISNQKLMAARKRQSKQ